MIITMHCGGMPFDGDTIKTKSLGGSETAAYYMAKELAKQGHEVIMFTNMSGPEKYFDGVLYASCGEISEDAPLGKNFQFYASSTPCDVMIIQRHPAAFQYKWESKINLLWLHDLALHRNKDSFHRQMWNIDGVLTVSEYHKKQVCEVYGINPDVVYPITNGIDLNLFNHDNAYAKIIDDIDKFCMLYSSRPERGLEHLVRPGGIMDRLQKEAPEANLYVCAYDNVAAHMRDYYNWLWEQCDKLPNVTNLGSLTKQELADVMRQCDLHVYPTEFEEVSCITAMEAMAAGLPMLTSNHAALPETTQKNVDSGTVLIDLKDGKVNEDKFVQLLKEFISGNMIVDDEVQTEAAKFYSWERACTRLMTVVEDCFGKYDSCHGAKAKELLRNGDIYALQKYIEKYYVETSEDMIFRNVVKEFEVCYEFMRNDTFFDHYQAYYEYEKKRGVNYGPEDLANNSRFEYVSSIVAGRSTGSDILDYGCAHGHYTINLAKRFPDKHFYGIDITASNIEKARQWAKDEGITNVTFAQGFVDEGELKVIPSSLDINTPWNWPKKFDTIIAAEVLEHLKDPALTVDVLGKELSNEGMMIITTPFGPWEYESADQHWPWRAHVHHLEKEDLKELWGMHKNFKVTTIPTGPGNQDILLGSYGTTFGKPSSKSGTINYERKFRQMAPRQTVSVCMIVKDAESTLRKSLLSVGYAVDEINIAIDRTTKDRTKEIIEEFKKDTGHWPVVRYDYIDSPLASGFDEARNTSIEGASGDWIVWFDSDEEFQNTYTLWCWLRENQYNGYAVRQHHFSVQPLGVIKTDLPCRVFRNHKGIKFFGLVHEHPEIEMNKGVGYVINHPFLEIIHPGYADESTRRKRFLRNINLLREDRKENPERQLGKFLWIRDLAQSVQFGLENNGNRITSEMIEAAKEAVELFKDMLQSSKQNNYPSRYVSEALPFYSSMCQVLGSDFEYGIKIGASKMNGGVHLAKEPEFISYFDSLDTAKQYTELLLEEKLKHMDSRYY